jgi:hypothetical protein
MFKQFSRYYNIKSLSEKASLVGRTKLANPYPLKRILPDLRPNSKDMKTYLIIIYLIF